MPIHLDITTAATSPIDDERMAAIAAFMRAGPHAGTRGPLAFVVDPKRGAQARKFAELTAGERPVKVFNSLREARTWVSENMPKLFPEATGRRDREMK